MPEQEGSGKERVLAVGRHRVERGAGIEGWLPILLVLEHGDRVRREITKQSRSGVRVRTLRRMVP